MNDYEMIIGLETHVELKTNTKIFCGCKSEFGGEPNTHVCPTCMGLPGALPMLNAEAVRLAAIAGIATGCHVHNLSRFDRKNYFYPDLPKAYQISQFYEPLCERGGLSILTKGGEKRIGITRIHIEEDAGKLLHDEGDSTALDMNRCGVPLIEIVSEPDIRSAEEASAFLRKLRSILIYTGVSDCRMNEGGMRCDVNLSVRKRGEPFGVRTEMKNLNSFQSVERAIASEYARQTAVLESGGAIEQETCRYDQKTGKTYGMRRKENSADYRYFPEPNLPPVYLSNEYIQALRLSLPALPDERREGLMRNYGLTAYSAELITSEKELCAYFEDAARLSANPVALANLLLGECFALMSKRGCTIPPIKPEALAALADMTAAGIVNSSTGKRILAALFDGVSDPLEYARENDMLILNDENALREAVDRVLAQNPVMVLSYKAGKISVEKALMGKAMAETRGKADPERLMALLREALSKLA